MFLRGLYSRFLSIEDYEAEVYTVRSSNNFRLNSSLLVVLFMDNHSVDVGPVLSCVGAEWGVVSTQRRLVAFVRII